jgi:hypothetical protein
MFVTGSQIARWNTQSFVYALVMIAGVGVFFLGLLFFIIDSQPRVVWLTTLLISGIAYILIVGVQLFCGFLASIRSLPSARRFTFTPHSLTIERRHRKIMCERAHYLLTVYEACSAAMS